MAFYEDRIVQLAGGIPRVKRTAFRSKRHFLGQRAKSPCRADKASERESVRNTAAMVLPIHGGAHGLISIPASGLDISGYSEFQHFLL